LAQANDARAKPCLPEVKLGEVPSRRQSRNLNRTRASPNQLAGVRTNCRDSLQRETQMDRDLPVGNVAALDVAARLDDLEPAQILQGLGCLCDRDANRVVIAFRGRT